ncbi:MAG TPA: LSm family protein [Nevskiaceae bacterium]|nr:LSm family protein [Nevskiaceae bacterium]
MILRFVLTVCLSAAPLLALGGCASTAAPASTPQARLQARLEPGQTITVHLRDGRAFRGVFRTVDEQALYTERSRYALAEVEKVTFRRPGATRDTILQGMGALFDAFFRPGFFPS